MPHNNVVKNKNIVIKIGSNVLSGEGGKLDTERIERITAQVALLKKNGMRCTLISSGAVAAGRGMIQLPDTEDVVSKRQVFASVGQVLLMNTYADFFSRHAIPCAQVLVTKEDFRDRQHYRNMQNCLETLLRNDIVPIVNENDVISVTELMFTDNDELAGLVASMLNAGKLIILTNVDGIYNGNPNMADSQVIHAVKFGEDVSEFISAEKSHFGRGGMTTKCGIARKTAALGIPVQIANGKAEDILLRIMQEENVGTLFHAKRSASGAKKWIAHSESSVKGTIVIDEGARNVLLSEKPTSLLPVGIVKITGSFAKGDLIRITDKAGNALGLGKAQYNSGKALELKGKKNQKPVVHYDYLFLY